MAEDVLDDIDSLIVTKNTESKQEEPLDVEAGVWYEAKVAKIKPYDKKDGKFVNKNLRWIFELQGEQFVTDYNGQPQQRGVLTSTSTYFAQGSRLCELYCSITGKSVDDVADDKPSIKSLIGKPCFIMIGKTSKQGGGYWYNIEAVKPANSKQSKQPVKPAKSPDNVKNPEDIEFVAEEVKKPVQNKQSKKDADPQFTAEEEELFKDLLA